MKKLILIMFACTFAGLVLTSCGDDDCPTCPEEPSYSGHFSGMAYLSMLTGFKGFYIYDTDSSAIVDSVMQPGYAAGTIVQDVSADGKYLAVSYNALDGQEIRIYDLPSKSIISILPVVGITQFIDQSNRLLVCRGQIYYKYIVPSFEKVSEDTLFSGIPIVHPLSRSIFIVVDHHFIYQVSYDSMKLLKTWDPIDPEFDIPIFIRHFDIHPSGDFLYIVGSSANLRFFVYDLKNDTLVSAYPMYFDFGRLKVTPDGGEVWVTDPGRIDIPFNPPEVGTVYIFDAYTGAYTGGISLYGYVADDPLWALDATGVEFSPDGKEAYVSTGAIGARDNAGTILRFDARSRKLISNIFPQIDRFPYGVVVGPRP